MSKANFDFQFPGGLTARVTPVPIPNTEVKPCRADDTALETARERRSPPGLNFKGRSEQSDRPFSFSLHADLTELKTWETRSTARIVFGSGQSRMTKFPADIEFAVKFLPRSFLEPLVLSPQSLEIAEL